MLHTDLDRSTCSSRTNIFYEQVSELQACGVTEESILSAGSEKRKGAFQQVQGVRVGVVRRAASLVAVGLILAAREVRGLGLPSGRECSPLDASRQGHAVHS